MKELLEPQAQLNAALDLDKSDAQAAEQVVEPVMETAIAPIDQRAAGARGLGQSSTRVPQS